MRQRAEPAFLLLAMTFPTVMAWLYFDGMANGSGTPNPTMQVLYSIGKVLQFAIPVIAWAIVDRARLRPQRPTWRGLPWALAFGFSSLAGIVGVYFTVMKGSPLLAELPAAVRPKIAELGIASPNAYLAFAVFISLVHAWLEEYYWRGFVFEGLSRRMPVTLAVIISAIAFTSHHVVVIHVYSPHRFWTGTLPMSLGVMLGGLVWARLYHLGKTIWPSWLSHALIDLAIMTVGYDLAFGW